jgi:nitrogen regulatory protein P-II 1
MKQITAYVKPHMVSKVVMALNTLEGLTGLTVSSVQGFGRSKAKGARNRIVEDLVEYVPHMKIEIFSRDELTDKIISIIQENAHTGLRGDGKIYVVDVQTAIRISTGERGEAAV